MPATLRPREERPERRAAASGQIWMGDIVRAWRLLDASSIEDRRAIAEALGFDYVVPGSGGNGETADAATTEPAVQGTIVAGGTGAPVHTASPGPRVELPLEQIGMRRSSLQSASPVWLTATEPLGAEREEHLTVRPPLLPLFKEGWTRAILSAGCATATDDGPIDVTRVIDAVARCRPVTAIPRKRVPSLRYGIQLLVDRGENLMPFGRDVRALTQQLLLVIGRDRSRVLYFDGCPTTGCGPGARSTWQRTYEPPAAGTPIVVLTDLGMARGHAGRSRVTDAAWLEFLAVARSAGCPVVIFAPYPLQRWPAPLRAAVRAIPWDRATTVSQVRQAARRADRRG